LEDGQEDNSDSPTTSSVPRTFGNTSLGSPDHAVIVETIEQAHPTEPVFQGFHGRLQCFLAMCAVEKELIPPGTKGISLQSPGKVCFYVTLVRFLAVADLLDLVDTMETCASQLYLLGSSAPNAGFDLLQSLFLQKGETGLCVGPH
jgi:hypothetical protein